MRTQFLAVFGLAVALTGCSGAPDATTTNTTTATPQSTGSHAYSVAPATILRDSAGRRSISVPVVRTGGAGGWDTVRYTLRDVTAINGLDYRAPESGELTFAPAETERSITVDVLDDAAAAAGKFFEVSLQDESGALLAFESDVVSLEDPDVSPPGHSSWFAVYSGGAFEGDAVHHAVEPAELPAAASLAMLFAVVRGGDTSLPAEVAYRTWDGTAHAGEDYETMDGTLAFAPGQNVQWIRVPVIDNSIRESTENFFVRLTSASALIVKRDATGTILDDDSGPLPSAGSLIKGNAYCEQILRSPTSPNALCLAVACATGEPLFWAACPGVQQLSDLFENR
jgi:hypothetical protein